MGLFWGGGGLVKLVVTITTSLTNNEKCLWRIWKVKESLLCVHAWKGSFIQSLQRIQVLFNINKIVNNNIIVGKSPPERKHEMD